MGVVHVAGHPALDFIGTLTVRGMGDVEELVHPAVLAGWWSTAGIVDAAPPVSRADLTRAVAVREAMYRVVRAWTEGEVPAAADAELLNTVAATAPVGARLDPGDGVVHEGSADQCLGTLVRSLFRLIATEPVGHVRWCADDHCSHPFLDTSRAQARRWCDMATCGARNKQRAFRARRSG